MKAYVVALLLVVGILGGFYGGYKIGHNNVSANTTGQTPTARGGNVTGGFGGGRGAGGVCPSPGAPTPSPGARAVATVHNGADGRARRGTPCGLLNRGFTGLLEAAGRNRERDAQGVRRHGGR